MLGDIGERRACKELRESKKIHAFGILFVMMYLRVMEMARASAVKTEAHPCILNCCVREREGQYMARPAYLPPFILEALVKNIVELVRRESKMSWKSALGFLEFCVGGPSQGRKNSRRGEEKRRGSIKDGGGG